VGRLPFGHALGSPTPRPEIRPEILRVRKARPTWGSKKILAVLERDKPAEEWPSRSTVDAILQRAGVVVPRGKRARRQPSAPPAGAARRAAPRPTRTEPQRHATGTTKRWREDWRFDFEGVPSCP